MSSASQISNQLLSAVKQKSCRQVFLLGNSDSGKTTFLGALADQLLSTDSLAVVDLDTGQSRIGPPTTIAWGFVPPQKFSWQAIKVENLYFTGTTTAVGNLLPTLTGCVLICQAALAKANKVLIDTCGLVAPGPGTALKRAQIAVLKPDVIVALEHSNELDLILEPFLDNPQIHIFRLKVGPGVTTKTITQRTAYREEQFRLYFQGAQIRELFWGSVALYSFSPAIDVKRALTAQNQQFFQGRLVSCRHYSGLDLALAVILDVDFSKEKLKLLTPLTEEQKEQVKGVVFSQMVVEPQTGAHWRSF